MSMWWWNIRLPNSSEIEEVEDETLLLGFTRAYQTMRSFYGMVVPDKITIFRKRSRRWHLPDDEIEEQINKTIRHEIAHHHSSEETLREIEGYDEEFQ